MSTPRIAPAILAATVARVTQLIPAFQVCLTAGLRDVATGLGLAYQSVRNRPDRYGDLLQHRAPDAGRHIKFTAEAVATYLISQSPGLEEPVPPPKRGPGRPRKGGAA